jgi:hypothetical protein
MSMSEHLAHTELSSPPTGAVLHALVGRDTRLTLTLTFDCRAI